MSFLASGVTKGTTYHFYQEVQGVLVDASGTKAAPEFMFQTEVSFLVGCGVLTNQRALYTALV